MVLESAAVWYAEIRWRVRLGLMGRTGAKEATEPLESGEAVEPGERGRLGGG